MIVREQDEPIVMEARKPMDCQDINTSMTYIQIFTDIFTYIQTYLHIYRHIYIYTHIL